MLLPSGCSSHAPIQPNEPGPETEAQLEQQLQRLDASLKESSRLQQRRISTLEERVGQLEQKLQSQQAQIAALSKAMETLKHKPRPSAAKKPVVHPSPPQPAQPPLAAVPAPVAPTEAEKNSYTAAYLALKSGRYEEASQGFVEHLKNYPEGEYADQAWYWLGESQLAQKQEKQAMASFERVVRDFPSSVKHAAALLRLGQIQQARGKRKSAEALFNRLIAEHPESTAAEQARSALAAMRTREQEK